MSRYKSTLTNESTENKNLKYNTTIYEEVPERNDDVFLVSQTGDRLDKLAHQFYGDSSLWWYIARVNNLKHMNIKPGISLRIPVSTEFARGT